MPRIFNDCNERWKGGPEIPVDLFNRTDCTDFPTQKMGGGFRFMVVGDWWLLVLARSVTVAARWSEISGSIAVGNSRSARVEPRPPGTSPSRTLAFPIQASNGSELFRL